MIDNLETVIDYQRQQTLNCELQTTVYTEVPEVRAARERGLANRNAVRPGEVCQTRPDKPITNGTKRTVVKLDAKKNWKQMTCDERIPLKTDQIKKPSMVSFVNQSVRQFAEAK